MFSSSGFTLASTCSEDLKPSVEHLYSKSLLVAVSERGSLSFRKSKLCVTIERIANSSSLRKELVIRLTDEYDPFLIYNLNLNEEDFQQLKLQQGLLIDFPSFPQKFIDLLELCLQEERKETPKFLLNLKSSGVLGCENIDVNLDIIETNPFKHLTHLSLKLLPATDAFIKKFLASCLKSYKDEKNRLDVSLRNSQTEYQNHLQNCQTTLSSRNQEIDRVRQTLQNEICGLTRKHAEELRNEEERVLRVHKEAEFNWLKEKKEIEGRNAHEFDQLKEKAQRLELQNEELQDKVLKSESQTREIRSHFVTSEDELYQLRHKNVTLTKENKSLDLQFHEHLKSIGTLKAQLSASMQEIRDKEQIFVKTQELLKTTQEQKKQLEELLDQKQALVTKRESALRTVSEDLNKGNEIIKKLQMEIRNYHAKLKIHSEVACKQEEAIQEKENAVKVLDRELTSYRKLAEEKESEISKLRNELITTNDKLEEVIKHNKSNENVIAWLNKQLNENGVPRRGFTSTVTDPIHGVSSIRHAAMTSTPSVPQTIPYQARTINRFSMYPSIPAFSSNPNYGGVLSSGTPPDLYARKTVEPDPIVPPTATGNANTIPKQIGVIGKNQRSSFPPQNRASKFANGNSKTPPLTKSK